jgi:hypothetical protein
VPFFLFLVLTLRQKKATPPDATGAAAVK